MSTYVLQRTDTGIASLISETSDPASDAAGMVVRMAGSTSAGLLYDFDGTEQQGLWTLSATPGTVTSITLPDTARIAVVIAPSADVIVRLNGDPAALGSGAFAAGSVVKAGVTRAYLLAPGASRTLRVRSATASATVTIEVRP